MSTPVPILQREEEFTQLLDLYREHAPKRVLEIGTYHGGTLYHWLQNATPGTRVVTVDSYVTPVDNRHLYSGWVPDGVDLDVIEGDNRDPLVLKQVVECSPYYDWVFIDAGHLYDEVKSDWLNYGPLCSDGGVVCFHDILYSRAAQWNHVARLWAEIADEYKTCQFISDPTTEWHGIGCVFM